MIGWLEENSFVIMNEFENLLKDSISEYESILAQYKGNEFHQSAPGQRYSLSIYSLRLAILYTKLKNQTLAMKWFQNTSGLLGENFKERLRLGTEGFGEMYGSPSYSYVTADVAIDAIYLAIIARQLKTLRTIAEAVTIDRIDRLHTQRPGIVYMQAFREFLLDNPDESIKVFSSFKKSNRHQELGVEADLLLNIAEKNSGSFKANLEERLAMHHKQATRGFLRDQIERFICIPATALCRLATDHGMVFEIPTSNYLPTEILNS